MVPDEKGRELERAVHAIEAVILESSPALREKPFTIEARKRIAVGGVHHEIDIFVTVEVAKGTRQPSSSSARIGKPPSARTRSLCSQRRSTPRQHSEGTSWRNCSPRTQ